MTIAVTVAVSATVLFAWVCGGAAERIGGAIFAVNVALNFLLYGLLDQGPLVIMACDLAAAVAFGVLAVRAPDKLWPGIAGVGQTLVVMFSATRLLDYPLSPLAYMIAVNLAGITVELALVAGTWMSRWGSKRSEHGPLTPELGCRS